MVIIISSVLFSEIDPASELSLVIDGTEVYLKPILKIGMTTGMRRDEILETKWKDFSLALRTLRIPAENAKSKKERAVPVDAARAVEIDALPRLEEYIFINPVAASHLVKATDVVTAARILGHSSLDITMRYVHPTDADKRDAVRKAAENLFGKGQKKANAPKQPLQESVENRVQIN